MKESSSTFVIARHNLQMDFGEGQGGEEKCRVLQSIGKPYLRERILTFALVDR